MRLLTVPQWSFGRDRDLLRRFEAILEDSPAVVHDLHADLDHNRTVSAFSAEPDELVELLRNLCAEAFERIDLNRHMGVYPRIGALDVCPIVLVPGEDSPSAVEAAQKVVSQIARMLAQDFEVPVFLYERSESGRQERDLAAMRRGGFGSLLEKDLEPDEGPARAHRRLGASVVGLRDWLLQINLNVGVEDASFVQEAAARVRLLRSGGDPRFLGVRAMGLVLPSRSWSQLSLNLALPDLTPIDPIVDWFQQSAAEARVSVPGVELVGPIRSQDLEGATRVPIREQQVVGPSA